MVPGLKQIVETDLHFQSARQRYELAASRRQQALASHIAKVIFCSVTYNSPLPAAIPLAEC